jgi:hypothetical protein
MPPTGMKKLKKNRYSSKAVRGRRYCGGATCAMASANSAEDTRCSARRRRAAVAALQQQGDGGGLETQTGSGEFKQHSVPPG